jgi:glucosamine kinase
MTSDFDGGIGRLLVVLENLRGRAGLESLADVRAHLGLAGVIGTSVSEAVGARLPFERAVVSDDRPTAMAGALGSRDGAVIAVGTGSFVGRVTQGEMRFVGGHGFFIGDQASGAWLGRRLLQEVVLAEDGLRAASDLSREMVARFGGAAEMARFAAGAEPEDFAGLARDVAAAAGDPIAVALMQEGADYLERALVGLGFGEGEALCLIGGLGPRYEAALAARFGGVVAARGSALDGAVILARS